MFSRRIAAVAASVLLLTLGLGCYQTKTPLGSAASATVDRAYVGDFVMPGENKPAVVIRNLDDKQYFVEYTESKDDREPMRMVGYTAKVNGATFANLRGLTDNGSIDDQFLIMRVSLSPDHAKLSLRELKEEFFKGKNVSSSRALRNVIEANLDNDLMYEGQAHIFTRKLPATQP